MSIERALAGFMKYGALAAVTLCFLGTIGLVVDGGLPTRDQLSGLSGVDYGIWFGTFHAGWVALSGLVLLVVVSVGRLLLCAFLFLRQGDIRFAVISVFAVLLVAVAALFRLM